MVADGDMIRTRTTKFVISCERAPTPVLDLLFAWVYFHSSHFRSEAPPLIVPRDAFSALRMELRAEATPHSVRRGADWMVVSGVLVRAAA